MLHWFVLTKICLFVVVHSKTVLRIVNESRTKPLEASKANTATMMRELQLQEKLWSKLPWYPATENISSLASPKEERVIFDPNEGHGDFTSSSTTIDPDGESLRPRSRRFVHTGRIVEGGEAIQSIDTRDRMKTDLSLSERVAREITSAFAVFSQSFGQNRDVQLEVTSSILEDAKNLEEYIKSIEDSMPNDSIELSLISNTIDTTTTSNSVAVSTVSNSIDDAVRARVNSLEVTTFSDITSASTLWNEDSSYTDKSAVDPSSGSARRKAAGVNLIHQMCDKGHNCVTGPVTGTTNKARCSQSHETLTGAPGLSTITRSHSSHTALTGSHELQEYMKMTKPACSARCFIPRFHFLRRWPASPRNWQDVPARIDSGLAQGNEATTECHDIALADSNECTTNTNSTRELKDYPRQAVVSSLSSSSTWSMGSRNMLKKTATAVGRICDQAKVRSGGVLKYVRRQRTTEAETGASAPSAELIDDKFSFASLPHTDWNEYKGPNNDASQRNSDLKEYGKDWISPRLRSIERTGKSTAKPGEILDSTFAEWIKHVLHSDDDSSSHEDWIEDTTLFDFSLNHIDRLRGMTFLDQGRRGDMRKDGGAAILQTVWSSESEPIGLPDYLRCYETDKW